jgi:hypothetical protein
VDNCPPTFPPCSSFSLFDLNPVALGAQPTVTVTGQALTGMVYVNVPQ